jgi:hypothetical protein
MGGLEEGKSKGDIDGDQESSEIERRKGKIGCVGLKRYNMYTV